MKKSNFLVAALAGLALAASACGPMAAPAGGPPAAGGYGPANSASPAPTQVQSEVTPGSDAYGYGNGAATAAPTQEPSSDSTGYGAGSPLDATAAPAESGAAMSGTVDLGSGALGSFLVDSQGMTLYVFLKDTPGSGSSACTGGCATAWPALSEGSPTAGSGVDASKLGTITGVDGNPQVTYNGRPLYHFAKDVNPGDTMGQGFNSLWYVVSPAGDPLQ